MQAFQAGRLHIFRPEDGGSKSITPSQIGHARPAKQPVLARLHSACFTGDVLGSAEMRLRPAAERGADADGGRGVWHSAVSQPRGARHRAGQQDAGLFGLQDQGFDTVEANHRLGFEDDERDFRIGAKLLERMGFDQVRLLTNNPAKVAMLQGHGIKVTERVPLKVGLTPENEAYLATKALKSGHLL